MLCAKNVERTTLYSMPTEKYCEFTDFSKTIKHPFVIYADFEAILVPESDSVRRHEPIAAGLLFLKLGKVVEYHQFVGEGCVENFLRKCEELAYRKVRPWYKYHGSYEMKPLSTGQERIISSTGTLLYVQEKTG